MLYSKGYKKVGNETVYHFIRESEENKEVKDKLYGDVKHGDISHYEGENGDNG